jgi:hypothetical protein
MRAEKDYALRAIVLLDSLADLSKLFVRCPFHEPSLNRLIWLETIFDPYLNRNRRLHLLALDGLGTVGLTASPHGRGEF